MIDFEDVQSVVLRPSKAATVDIRFLTHSSPDEMQAFLLAAGEAVTTVAKANEMADARPADGPPPGALNVGITGEGLRLCSLEDRVLGALPSAFTDGMRAAATRLHDDPDQWEPRFRDGPPVHAVVLRYGDFDWDGLGLGVDDGSEWHGQRAPDFTEPFGFKDNISDPVIEGSGKPMSEGAGVWDPEARQWRPVRTGEAIMGYLDESGVVAGNPDTAYLERNGSYFVMRKLEQDVEGFWQACTDWAEALGPDVDPQDIGAQMVGRHKDGRVLGQPPGADPVNGFLFREERSPDVPMPPVPPSAHIRRSNPRDGMEFADKIVPRHVLFRRGYPYDEGGAKGLLFMACCADLRRQFEFVQSHWLQDGNRFGLGTETDALAGQRTTSTEADAIGGKHTRDPDNDVLSIDWGGKRVRRWPISSFVTTRGGEYVLLPSRSALRVLGTPRVPSRPSPRAAGMPSAS